MMQGPITTWLFTTGCKEFRIAISLDLLHLQPKEERRQQKPPELAVLHQPATTWFPGGLVPSCPPTQEPPTAERAADAASVAVKWGNHGLQPCVVVECTVQLSSLPNPGLACVETSWGDVLGPWVPLVIVPLEEVAAEINSLAKRYVTQ